MILTVHLCLKETVHSLILFQFVLVTFIAQCMTIRSFRCCTFKQGKGTTLYNIVQAQQRTKIDTRLQIRTDARKYTNITYKLK